MFWLSGCTIVNYKKRLFDEDDLTAEKAEKLILNHEISSSHTRYIKDDDENKVSVVARLGRRDDRSRSRQYRRGRWNRDRSFSPVRSRSRSRQDKRGDRFSDRRFNNRDRAYLCSFCKKTGHTRRFCYLLNGKDNAQVEVKFLESPRESSRPPTPGRNIGNFKRSSQSEDEDEELPCLMISSVNHIN